MLEKKHVELGFRAAYHLAGNLASDAQTICMAFHGYGQLSEFFVKKLLLAANDQVRFVMPQGLSKFYLSGFSGKVGASWITKHDREIDIGNLHNYLNAIYHREILTYRDQTKNLLILGFSQGAATAARWAIRSGIPASGIVLWGGFLPHDVPGETIKNYFSDKRLSLVFGDSDEFIGQKHRDEINQKIRSLGLNPEMVHYPGGHEIKPEILRGILGC